MGYLPGDLPIYPDLNARAYLRFLAAIGGRAVSQAYLNELLVRFDVSEIDLRRRLRVQSHGMKQKIGIIQALMSRPPVVILDEPTAGLDPLMVQAFKETVLDLKRSGDVTVFLSSHVLTEVESTCDRIGIVCGGRLNARTLSTDLQGRLSTAVGAGSSVALFLLSPESSYCTGALFTADGGFTLGIPHYR